MDISKLKTIDKIYHISDIHIRLYKRYSEYIQVFENLYKFIESRKDLNSVIVLSGDLFHSKTELSPLSVKLAINLLDNLSKFMPVILFAGNHDGNLNNKNRLDSISPIINELNNNIIYLTLSKIYELLNIQFYLCSVYDLKVIPSSELDSDKIKIFLYHGIVDKIDIGSNVLENKKMQKLLFDGYDYVLLGDIHRHQFLQHKYENLPAIAYPGSLIQQSFGLQIKFHGLILWNLKEETHSFHEIENDFGYITFNIENNVLLNPDLLLIIPKKPRVRLRTKYCTLQVVYDFIRELKNKSDVQLLHVFDVTNKNSTNLLFNVLIADNLYNVLYQNTLISDFCLRSSTVNVTLELLNNILSINTLLNRSQLISLLKKNQNIFWKPVLIRFSNMFSYGLENVINFLALKGNVGIIGPNRVGKSSIIDIILFTLFDKTSRAFKALSIINVNKFNFSCSIDILLNNKLYRITRSGIKSHIVRKKYLIDVLPVTVLFNLINSDGLIIQNLSGIDRDLTNKIIVSYFGNYNNFITTTFSLQNDSMGFLKLSQTERKKFLSQILNVDIFLKLYNKSKLILKLLNYQLNQIDYQQTLDKLDSINKLNEAMLSLNTCLLETIVCDKEYLLKLKIEYANCLRLYKPISKLISSLSLLSIENKLSSLKNSLLENVDYLNDMLLMSTFDKSLILIKDKISSNITKLLTKLKSLNKTNNQLKILSNSLNDFIVNNSKLNNLNFDNHCEMCCANKIILIDEQLLIKINDSNNKLLSIKSLISKTDFLIKDYLKKVKLLKDILLLSLNLKNIQLKNEKLEYLKFKVKSDILKLLDNILKLTNLQQLFIKNVLFININKNLKDKLTSLYNLINCLLSSIRKNLITFTLNVTKIHSNNLNHNLLLISQLKYLTILLKIRYYLIYSSIMKIDGLQYYVIAKMIPVFLNKVNLILSLMCDFSVICILDGKDIDINIKNNTVNQTDHSWPVLLCCGLLKFILSLAVRIALLDISNLPKSLFIAIDLGFGNIDTDNLSSIGNIFSYLKTVYKYILIITHIHSMKNLIDMYILILKDDQQYSVVNNKS